MKKSLFIVCFFWIKLGFSQPSIVWDKTIGGNSQDSSSAIIQTQDLGFLICGYSQSNISGDKTVNSNGGSDIWLVKLDNDGGLDWQKTIGGNESDTMNDIEATNDGGFIIAGSSYSNISGDKTENSRGGSDYWIIKLDSTGTIVWQKTIGGDSSDGASSIQQTTDGGYIVGGSSTSGISGDKTEPCINNNGITKIDYWILKLDAFGNILWQNTIGGLNNDSFRDVKQTVDEGYLIGGTSASNISGDKTENAFGLSLDYWIVKLDEFGEIVWQKTLGGENDDELKNFVLTEDGGSILSGWSLSGISGNKTETSKGMADYWIIKLNNTGVIEWQKTFGGNDYDFQAKIMATVDGNFIVGGSSSSNISGDKTENSRGLSDIWIVKIDPVGNILWQETIGGDLGDGIAELIQTEDEGYALGANSTSSISGEKTEICRGESDYWIIKLASDNLTSNTFFDKFDVRVYPNPTIKNVYLNLKNEQKEIKVSLRNVLGELISYQKYNYTNSIITEINSSSGIYFLTIEIENLFKTYKIIKQ